MKVTKQALTSATNSDFMLEALKKIAPSAFTEVRGADKKLTHKVDFKVLRELLGDAILDADEECFGFHWVGKQDAKRAAAKPTRQTLRPVVEDSVDWDTTENLYIEGDNLEVMKLLQRGYLGKVKMIYIDPPYNTGNDFVYNDDFAMSQEQLDEAMNNLDEEGNRLRKNLDSNPRYHSDWCSMIYSRLLVARTLLANNGVIFISIDDNEVHHLRKICDEVFGAGNFVAELIWAAGRKNDSKLVSVSHEYILCYVKSLDTLKEAQTTWRERKDGLDDIYKTYAQIKKAHPNDYVEQTKALKAWYKNLADGHPAKAHKHYSRVDHHGIYFPSDISWPGGGGPKYDLVNPETGIKASIPSRGWITSEQTMQQWVSEGLVDFGEPGSVPTKKAYLKDKESSLPYSVFYKDGRAATKRLLEMFGRKVFDNPKDEDIIYRIVNIGTSTDSLILDFFSGSATTAHAVMQLNAEDGGKRKYICVQIPEETPEDSEARKAGYNTICEIGKERIRRAGKKIKEAEENKDKNIDTGFRVLRIDSSNMEDIYFEPIELSQDDLFKQVDSVKEGRTELDLLFGCMVDWGVELSNPLRTEEIAGKQLHIVNEGALVACFNKDINLEVIQHIAQMNPQRVIFRESCFEKDADKLNIYEQFKQLCGWNNDESYKRIHVI